MDHNYLVLPELPPLVSDALGQETGNPALSEETIAKLYYGGTSKQAKARRKAKRAKKA